ncbi:MAG TPA: hypothetical protein VKU42_14825, partial [Candidatus Angelobacter sp.]|nr:hypothetical protein [Candidatus Angelobacter sp.]
QNTMAPGMRTAQAPQQNSTQIAQPNFLQQAQSQGASSTQPVVPPQNTGTAPIANVGINGNKSPFAKGPNPSLFYGAPGGF